MFLVTVDEDTCTACNQCVETCPAQILGTGKDDKAEVTGDPTECMGCFSCTTVCESGSITVEEF